jgi:uncharacterized Zn finger protein (UPF0148 family)
MSDDFLRGPIPKQKAVVIVCPECTMPLWGVWSPLVTGVLKCPCCNYRFDLEDVRARA